MFILQDDCLYSTVVIGYKYEGPVAKTRKPGCQAEVIELLDDPVKAVWRLGEKKVIEAVRDENNRGFYSVKTSALAFNYAIDYLYDAIIGEVDLFGKVVEHECGYRAEKLRIAKLYVHAHVKPAVVASLESRYQCEVEKWTSEENAQSGKSSLMMFHNASTSLMKPTKIASIMEFLSNYLP